jgi:hypothetical protein
MTDLTAPSPTRKSLLSFLTADAFRPVDPLAVAKMTPAVTERRIRFQKYAKIVVGVCAALCLIAGVRVAVASEPEDAALASTTPASVHKARMGKSLTSIAELRASARAVAARRWGTGHHR